MKLVGLGLLRHAKAAVAFGTVLQACPEVGELVNDLRVIADSPPQVARLFEQQPTVEQSQIVVRLKREHKIKVGDCPVVVAHLRTEQATVVVAEEIVRLQVKGCVVVGHCSAQIVPVDPCQSPVYVVPGMARQEVDGLVEELLRLFPLALRKADQGAFRPRSAVIRVDFEALVESRDGLGCVVLHEEHFSPHRECRRILAPPRIHRVEFAKRGIIFLVVYAAKHAVVPQPPVLRVIAKCPRIVVDGSLVFSEPYSHYAAKLVAVHHVWIAIDCLGAIVLRPDEIVEVVFRHGPIEPRLVKIGLCVDGLVEILYRKHIVLVIKRTAPYCHEPVSIELRHCHHRHKEVQGEQSHLPEHRAVGFTCVEWKPLSCSRSCIALAKAISACSLSTACAMAKCGRRTFCHRDGRTHAA